MFIFSLKNWRVLWNFAKRCLHSLRGYFCLVLIILGYFFTGDGAFRTSKGYYQLTGRLDDVINVSGHRLGTAEVEDVMVRNECTIIVFMMVRKEMNGKNRIGMRQWRSGPLEEGRGNQILG